MNRSLLINPINSCKSTVQNQRRIAYSSIIYRSAYYFRSVRPANPLILRLGFGYAVVQDFFGPPGPRELSGLLRRAEVIWIYMMPPMAELVDPPAACQAIYMADPWIHERRASWSAWSRLAARPEAGAERSIRAPGHGRTFPSGLRTATDRSTGRPRMHLGMPTNRRRPLSSCDDLASYSYDGATFART